MPWSPAKRLRIGLTTLRPASSCSARANLHHPFPGNLGHRETGPQQSSSSISTPRMKASPMPPVSTPIAVASTSP